MSSVASKHCKHCKQQLGRLCKGATMLGFSAGCWRRAPAGEESRERITRATDSLLGSAHQGLPRPHPHSDGRVPATVSDSLQRQSAADLLRSFRPADPPPPHTLLIPHFRSGQRSPMSLISTMAEIDRRSPEYLAEMKGSFSLERGKEPHSQRNTWVFIYLFPPANIDTQSTPGR